MHPGCYRPPERQIVPYVQQPEGLVPGRALYFASTMLWNGYARPVVVEQHEGRPTKIEGNPGHGASLGATDAMTQASVLDMYDPDRSRVITSRGNVATWGQFVGAVRAWKAGGASATGAGTAPAARGGPRLAVLSGNVTSPLLAAQWERIREAFPGARWFRWEPGESGSRENRDGGARLAFGRVVQPVYDFAQAVRIVSLDANFLADDPGSVRYARDYAQRRRVRFKAASSAAQARVDGPAPADAAPTAETMNRMYVIESTVTITGAKADHRLPVQPSAVATRARDLAGLIAGEDVRPANPAHATFLRAAARDLLAHRGASLVLAGECQPAEVHALAHALNAALGNVGKTVSYIEPVENCGTGGAGTLAELTSAMAGDKLDALVILDANPVFSGPADLDFARVLRDFSLATDASGNPRHLTAHLGLYHDETAELCQWHVPLAHYLESWGDARAFDGSICLVQPLIAPLFDGRTPQEIFALLLGDDLTSPHDMLKEHWRAHWPGGATATAGFESVWAGALRNGAIPGTARAPVDVAAPALADMLAKTAATQPGAGGLEIRFMADPSIGDGRWANNGWLQELPKPIIKLTWDNAVLLSAATAVRLGLAGENDLDMANQRVVTVAYRGRKLDMPVWITPGHPDDTITVYLGYGRWRAGHVGNKTGFYSYGLRHADALWFDGGVRLATTDRTYPLASTQLQQTMMGRDFVRTLTIDAFNRAPPESETPNLQSMEPAGEGGKKVHLSPYPEYPYTGYKWGMVVDQTACIACNACVIACQAENNSPVVGKDQVRNMRQMHWMRIDTYFASAGSGGMAEQAANPEVLFQPMFCQQCEDAPCEVVCPVEATTHSDEGINEMTYNRCVGTRYCSNNCPYKVRRFNFLLYSDYTSELRKLSYNPNVTVRWRGVMEKCTYCIQRINMGRIDAKKAWVELEAQGREPTMRGLEADVAPAPRALPAMQVLTACQQACPAEALIFGDMNDAGSTVHRLKEERPYSQLEYGVLVELNTQPRTSYLRRLTNPNPELVSKAAHA